MRTAHSPTKRTPAKTMRKVCMGESYPSDELRELLGISVRTLTQFHKDGLPYSIVGGAYWYSGEDVLKYFAKIKKTFSKSTKATEERSAK